ncbi:MAG: response regulator [bacterium]
MKSILIVDDEQIVLDVLQRILLYLGYKVVITDTGEQAMEEFSTQEFDLVLMDVMMPGKNGFKVAREMIDKKPDQKIVIITGLSEDAVFSQPISDDVHVKHVLSKPFTLENVKAVLEEALHGQETSV